LTVHVVTPELGSVGLPVAVWIHGGAFHTGSPLDPATDLSTFCAAGIVGVHLSYRLGFDGFGLVPGAPANRGMLDLVAGLSWVADNIAAFGGDPSRVTLIGHSAGASAVLRLVTDPATRGLFRAGIAAAPAEIDVPEDDAARTAARMAAHLGVPATLEGFRSVPERAVFDAQSAAFADLEPTGTLPWVTSRVAGRILRHGPVVGPLSGARPMHEALLAGAGRDVPLLLGASAQELPVAAQAEIDLAGTSLQDALTTVSDAETARRWLAHRRSEPGGGTADTAAELLQFTADTVFRRPVPRFADALDRAWVYEFDHGPDDAPVLHGAELPYAFGRPPAPAGEVLARRVHDDWTGFITGSGPGWEPWGPAGTGRHYGAVVTERPLFARERDLWSHPSTLPEEGTS
jgi:para-nitrobenzyl esterase